MGDASQFCDHRLECSELLYESGGVVPFSVDVSLSKHFPKL